MFRTVNPPLRKSIIIKASLSFENQMQVPMPLCFLAIKKKKIDLKNVFCVYDDIDSCKNYSSKYLIISQYLMQFFA